MIPYPFSVSQSIGPCWSLNAIRGKLAQLSWKVLVLQFIRIFETAIHAHFILSGMWVSLSLWPRVLSGNKLNLFRLILATVTIMLIPRRSVGSLSCLIPWLLPALDVGFYRPGLWDMGLGIGKTSCYQSLTGFCMFEAAWNPGFSKTWWSAILITLVLPSRFKGMDSVIDFLNSL